MKDAAKTWEGVDLVSNDYNWHVPDIIVRM